MKKIIKEKRKHSNGALFRLTFISAIENNTKRRIALMLSFPVFFILNCLLMIPNTALLFVYNNIELLETICKRWDKPYKEEQCQQQNQK